VGARTQVFTLAVFQSFLPGAVGQAIVKADSNKISPPSKPFRQLFELNNGAGGSGSPSGVEAVATRAIREIPVAQQEMTLKCVCASRYIFHHERLDWVINQALLAFHVSVVGFRGLDASINCRVALQESVEAECAIFLFECRELCKPKLQLSDIIACFSFGQSHHLFVHR
jgi:hypothetical protein